MYRLMKIAVVHDLAEALVGDIVPHDARYTKEQKRAMEEVGGSNSWACSGMDRLVWNGTWSDPFFYLGFVANAGGHPEDRGGPGPRGHWCVLSSMQCTNESEGQEPFQNQRTYYQSFPSPTTHTGQELVELWLEYEDCSSPEARVVKDFDKCVAFFSCRLCKQAARPFSVSLLSHDLCFMNNTHTGSR